MKSKIHLKVMWSGVLLALLLSCFLTSAEVTDEGQGWENLRESYTYIWDDTHYNYNLEEPLSETYEEITIWDVESEENEISFRTDKLTVVLGMVSVENQTHLDLYSAAWLYENETESFKVTYRYDNVSQEIGIVDPLSLDIIGPNLGVPANMMELGINLFTWWKGLGFTFLPVNHTDFSFKADYGIYELMYEEFSLEFKDTFKFKRKKFEGYHYEISYVWEQNLYPGVMFRDEVCVYYSYNVQGVLYDFYNEYKFSTNKTGSFEVEYEGTFKYYISEYDETLIVSHNWIYGIGAIFVTATLILNKQRREILHNLPFFLSRTRIFGLKK